MTTNDPFDSANNATLPPPTFYGEIKTDAWFCYMKKGEPKAPFDPSIHPMDKRFTQIDMVIIPLPEQNVTNAKATERHLIAEFSDWVQIVLPSFKACGVSLKDLNGRFVKVECVPNGKKYQNKTTGEWKDETVFRLVNVYSSEDTCRKSYFADGNKDRRDGAAPTEQSTEETPVTSNGDDKERKTAEQFLKAIVNNAVRGETDIDKVNQKVSAAIAQYPLVNKYFTVQSQETIELIMQHFQPA